MRLFAASLMILILAGCRGSESVDPELTIAEAAPHEMEAAERDEPLDSGVELPVELNNTTAATLWLSAIPPVDDPATKVEIALHTKLYLAAHESNVGDITCHYLLIPALIPRGERDEPSLVIPVLEFRMRVLAAMANLGSPVAYEQDSVDGWSSQWFPGTRELATRLRIQIIERDPAHATVVAEICDMTPHVAASRQRVTAVWDGGNWNIERDRARVIW